MPGQAGRERHSDEAAVRPAPIVDLSALMRQSAFLRFVEPLIGRRVERFLRFDRLNADAPEWERRAVVEGPFTSALRQLDIPIDVHDAGLTALATRGPLLIVSNHPFGAVEALALGHLCGAARPNLKILGTDLLRRFAPLAPFVIHVDSFGRWSPAADNLAPLRQAVRHVRSGGALLIFPAGRVSHFRWSRLAVTDPPWTPQVIRLVRATSASVVPVFFPGRNGFAFNAVGVVHPLLRALFLVRELYGRAGGPPIRLAIGEPIPAVRVLAHQSDEKATAALRRAVYALASERSPR